MGTLSLVVALVAVFVASRVFNYYKAKKDLGNLPGLRSLVTPVSLFGAALPSSRFNPGMNWQWNLGNEVYREASTETVSVIGYLFGQPAIYTRSPEVARQIVSTKGQFFKERDLVLFSLMWGPNIVAANGDEWRRHRRIIAPAFSSATNASVWQQTARVFDEMEASEGWSNESVVNIPVANRLTLKLALILISTCGFGNPLNWQFAKSSTDEMPFEQALTIVTESTITRLITPTWAYSLPVKWLRELQTAINTMNAFMRGLVDERRKELASTGVERNDILSLMIKSNEEKGKFAMDDSELIGNTFLLLTAGHDTTARALDSALGFLAFHQDFQEEVYREVMAVMPSEDDFTFENSVQLIKVQACFLEALRLFPSAFMMIRDAAEDTVLQNVGPNGDELLPLKRGTRVVVDMVGLHQNPRLFPDPEEFKPERWYGAHENDLTMFSMGARSCPGSRFAITESMSFLARLLRRWRVRMLMNEGESKEEWKKRVMRGRIGGLFFRCGRCTHSTCEAEELGVASFHLNRFPLAVAYQPLSGLLSCRSTWRCTCPPE